MSYPKVPQISPVRRKLIGNMFWLYTLQGLNYIIPLAVLPYLVRVLGVERYGLVAFAQSLAQGFIFITDYGFNLSATKQISRVRHDQAEVSRIFWAVMTVKGAFLLFGMVILTAMLLTVPRFHADTLTYAIAYVAVLGSVLFPLWLFQGAEQMRYISVVSGGAKLLAAALLFFVVRHPSDYLLAVAVQSGGLLLAGVAGLWVALTRFKISFRFPSRKDLRQMLREGWHLFVASAAGMLYATNNVFLVGLMAGNIEAGYFSAAEKTVRGVQGLLTPTTQAIYPHVSILAAESRQRAVSFIRKTLMWMGLMSLAPSVLLLAFARPVALILFGAAAQGSIAPLRWIALLPFILTISSVLGIQTMIPFGLERQLSRIYVTTGLASVLPLLALIHYFGATGGAAAILIIETYIVAVIWTTLKQHGVDLLRGTATETISEIDSPPRLAHEYLGTATKNPSLSKSPATGSVL
ncbi:MAG: flippase [Candidatus Sulfotelmatobacter sp.]